MRTVIAALPEEVEGQLSALDAKRAGVARRYVARLALEPDLGHRLTRGVLGSEECRAVSFDRDSRPDDSFGQSRPERRRGNENLSARPGASAGHVGAGALSWFRSGRPTRPTSYSKGDETMILKGHGEDDLFYEIGDEIWEVSLGEAIRLAAETIVEGMRTGRVEEGKRGHRHALRERVIAAMTRALVGAGDGYRAPDGVLYSLSDERADFDGRSGEGRLARMPTPDHEPIVETVLRFEDLPLGSLASRRAVVRWSDGSEGEALRWYQDEILSPVDHVGRQ